MDWNNLKNYSFQEYVKTASNVMPTLKKNNFTKTGLITPEEFVMAGDLLVMKCPTWRWETASKKNRVSYLPVNKQYLVTKNVPINEKIITNNHNNNDISLPEKIIHSKNDSAKSWCAPSVILNGDSEHSQNYNNVLDFDTTETSETSKTSEDDIPNMEEFDLEEKDTGLFESPIRKISRTYDISITYDNYYQTPKVWLFGYHGSGKILTCQEMFEDISDEHAKKTVTVDLHPFENITSAFIHPCKHASVMKMIIKKYSENDTKIRVDQYMFLFLKFIGTIIPTINYDYTFEI